MENTLFYGDNLDWLRNERVFPDAFVDLVYLDPPFNSNRSYNVLFKGKAGDEAQAQIHAFDDTWVWSPSEYSVVNHDSRVSVAVKDTLEGMVKLAGKNALTGYLVMMAPRLVELHRVLKLTGSLYLHCDTTASHYLKLLLDAVFGPEHFLNEIIWKRSQPKGNTTLRFPRSHDVILSYSKSSNVKLNPQYTAHDPGYVETFYRHVEPETGRRYRLDNLANPNKNRPNLTYEFPPGSGVVRVWRWTRDRMMKAWEDGLVIVPAKGQVVAYKRYLDEQEGTPVTDIWDDIEHLHGSDGETLGYPTQKPLALLERIISSSSHRGDIVLDPFCGCGTAVVAAEKLGRRWLGIDITSLAIGVIEKRLRRVFPDAKFKVEGLPNREEDAIDLADRDKYDFQDWVVLRLGGQPIHEAAPGKSQKGGDKGRDGIIYFDDKGELQKVIISVKGGENYNPGMLRDLNGTLQREKAAIGVLVVRGKPTRGILAEVAEAEPYESGHILRGHTQFYPRLQVLSIADIIAGKGVEMPPHEEEQTMQTAKRGRRHDAEQAPLTFGVED